MNAGLPSPLNAAIVKGSIRATRHEQFILGTADFIGMVNLLSVVVEYMERAPGRQMAHDHSPRLFNPTTRSLEGDNVQASTKSGTVHHCYCV